MKRFLASLFVMFSVSALAQAYVPVTVLATYPHRELMDNQQIQCTEYYDDRRSGHSGVSAAIVGSGRWGNVVIESWTNQHYPPSYRQNCYPVNVRTMVTVGYKVTVRLPSGQNTLVHTTHEPPIGSVLYINY